MFEEKRSGTTDARPQLKECLNYVRDGDQLIVTRIDRLARSTLHLCQIAETLPEKGVDLVVLDQNIDTSDATGRLLFNMLGAIGQFETEIRAERQMDGIKKAKDRGVQFGKQPALTADQIAEREKRKQRTLIRDLMAEYSLSKATIYRKQAIDDFPRYIVAVDQQGQGLVILLRHSTFSQVYEAHKPTACCTVWRE